MTTAEARKAYTEAASQALEQWEGFADRWCPADREDRAQFLQELQHLLVVQHDVNNANAALGAAMAAEILRGAQ